MDNFKFRSFPNSTLTNIQDVAVNYNNKANGYPHADYGNFYSSNQIRNVVDGTIKKEGVTTCNFAYTNNSVDILVSESVLAHYDFYDTPGTYYGNAPPDWCNYMKVFLIGGGGGGTKSYQLAPPITPIYCGDGGGAGAQVISGVEILYPGQRPTITVGSGGSTDNTSLGILNSEADPGGNGGSSKIYIAGANLTIVAEGGEGGSNSYSTGHFPAYSGSGGAVSSHGDQAEFGPNSYVGQPGALKGEYKVSGNSSKRNRATQSGSYIGGGVNPGGVGALTVEKAEHYGFSGSGQVFENKALVREMIQSNQPGNGYGSGGNGMTGNYDYPGNTAGQRGCVCVFYFPCKPAIYPIAM